MAASTPVLFPTQSGGDAADYATGYFKALHETMGKIDLGEIAKAATLLGQIYDRGGRVFCIGNGGSASISDHLMCDHMKGVRTGTERRPNVCSLASNSAMITAIGNDISFEQIFVYQLESMAKAGDGLTGFQGGKARDLSDANVYVPVENYGISEDLHQSVMHILAQYLRMEKLAASTPLPQTKF
jgi:D-sedoheptulose 7-phosphate isomerase